MPADAEAAAASAAASASSQQQQEQQRRRSDKKKAADARANTAITEAPEALQSEEGSKALLREFMHSRKLMRTLAAFDADQPRGETTIQSRALMAELLVLTDLQRANKAREQPLKTLLEVVCDNRLARRDAGASAPSDYVDSDAEEHFAAPLAASRGQLAALEAELAAKQAELEKVKAKTKVQRKRAVKETKAATAAAAAAGKKKKKKQPLSIDDILAAGERNGKKAKAKAKKAKAKAEVEEEVEEAATRNDWGQLASDGSPSRGEVHGKSAADQEYRDEIRRVVSGGGGAAGASDAAEWMPDMTGEEGVGDGDGDDDVEEDDEDSATTDGPSPSGHALGFNVTDRVGGFAKAIDMGWGVDDGSDTEAAGTSSPVAAPASPSPSPMPAVAAAASPSLQTPVVRGRPVGQAVADRLQTLICGRIRFPDSWLQQGFYYSAHLPYGIVQNAGGPCGLLAVVQARVVKHLYFAPGGTPPQGAAGDASQVTEEAQRGAVLEALVETLLAAANGGSVQLALPPDIRADAPPAKAVDLEAWRVQALGREAAAVREAVGEHMGFFGARHGVGMLALLVSAVLTKGGVEAVLAEMDSMPGSESTLVVMHQYTSQELVSLLLFGKAHSNVFNGVKDMGADGSSLVLKGVPGPSEIGLLTYQEYTRDVEVGSFLKDPALPIWLVWNESHYCVCFSKTRLVPGAAKVDVLYYDPLGMQDEEYRLTIDTTREVPPAKANDITPYMDDILRTRQEWKGYVWVADSYLPSQTHTTLHTHTHTHTHTQSLR